MVWGRLWVKCWEGIGKVIGDCVVEYKRCVGWVERVVSRSREGRV